jgi:hypothetical protein
MTTKWEEEEEEEEGGGGKSVCPNTAGFGATY